MRKRHLLRVLRYRAHSYLGRYPRLLFSLYGLFGIHRGLTVTPSTQLLIEGFPRSSATFCSFAFLHAQGAPMNIALHIHVPAHVIRAVRLGIPTLVLIRQPRDAITSAILRDPHIPISAFAERYRLFYETLDAYRDDFVTADFADAVSDFGRVTDRINAKYDTSFVAFDHSEGNVATVFDRLDERQHRLGGGAMASYRPHEAKEFAKKHIDLSAHRDALERCETIYQRWSGATQRRR